MRLISSGIIIIIIISGDSTVDDGDDEKVMFSLAFGIFLIFFFPCRVRQKVTQEM